MQLLAIFYLLLQSGGGNASRHEPYPKTKDQVKAPIVTPNIS